MTSSRTPPPGHVLSIFPGGGLLDHAFELEGFCVVRGPDPIWGGDVRHFHPPPRVYAGVIGGDPCQSHTPLANLVRAKGLEPTFPDLTHEFARIVEATEPDWFLRENVDTAPPLLPAGYSVRSFLLNLAHLADEDGNGHEQERVRRWWFGVRGGPPVDLQPFLNYAWSLLPAHDDETLPLFGGPSDRRRVSTVGGHDGHVSNPAHYREEKKRTRAVTGRHHSNELRRTKERGDGWVGMIPRRTLAEMLKLQGLPADWLDHQPWTMEAKRKIVGNGVPIPMGRALAWAIRARMEGDECERRGGGRGPSATAETNS